MDLTLIPGIGPEYGRRLKEAGIPDVAALALAPDLSTLAEKTAIPPARLATFQASALDMSEEAGIAIHTVAPFQEVAQTLWRAAEDIQEDVAGRAAAIRRSLREAVASVRTRADEAVAHASREAARGLAGIRQAYLGARTRGKAT
jgi:hypothetical protein